MIRNSVKLTINSKHHLVVLELLVLLYVSTCSIIGPVIPLTWVSHDLCGMLVSSSQEWQSLQTLSPSYRLQRAAGLR